MVLGIRSKSRKSVSIQVHFVIHVQEIKPWLPSKSLKSAQSVILQWENGDQNYGSFASSAENGKLEFNETLRFSAHLRRESSKRGRHRDGFHKNLLEFHLYDIQNGKSAKSQLLGSATINLADYGIIKETTAVSIPVNFKRSSKNSAQPFLNLSVQPFDIESSSSSPKSSLSKELSTDKEESESPPLSPNYENDEDLEIASFTDDESEDVSSTSSQTVQSASETTGDITGISIGGTKGLNREFILPLETASTSSLVKAEAEPIKQLNGIKPSMSSPVVPSDMGKNAMNGSLSVPKSHGKSVNNSYSNYKIPESIHQSSRRNITRDVEDKIISSTSYIPVDAPSNIENSFQSQTIQEVSWRGQIFNKDGLEKVSSPSKASILEGKQEKEQKEKGEEESISMSNKLEEKVVLNLSEDDSIRKGKLKSVTVPLSGESHEQPTGILNMDDKTEDRKSHKLPLDTAGNNRPFSRNQVMDLGEENRALKVSHKGVVRRGQGFDKDGLEKVISSSKASILEGKAEKEQKEKGEEEKISMNNKLEEKDVLNLSEDDSIGKGKLKSVTVPLNRESHKQPTNILNMDDKIGDGKSHKLPLDTDRNNRLFSRNQAMDLGEENSALKVSHKGVERRGQRFEKDGLEKVSSSSNAGILEGKEEKEQKEKGEEKKISMSNKPVEKVVLNLSEDDSTRKGKLKSVTVPLRGESREHPTSILNMDDKTEDGKSHKLPLDTAGNNRPFSRYQVMDLGEENSALKVSHKGVVRRGQRFDKDGLEKVSSSSNDGILEGKEEKEQIEKGEEKKISMSNKPVGKVVLNLLEDNSIRKGNLKSVTVPLGRESHEQPTSILNMDDKTEDGKPHKLPLDTAGNNRLFIRNQVMDLGEENSALKDSHKGVVWRGQRFNKIGLEKVSSSSNASILEGKEEKEQKEKGEEEKISTSNNLVEKVVLNLSDDDSIRKGKLKSVTVPLSREPHEQPASILNMDDKTEDMKSHKLPLDTAENNSLFSRNQAMDLGEENSALKDSHKGAVCHAGPDINDSRGQAMDQGEENSALKDSHNGAVCHAGPGINNSFLNSTAEIKSEVEMLQEELREAAALEVSLYSVVADHGSSANKVHTPARRLSRFYFHAYKVGSPATRASAAQSAVSGFVLVSKACGNDVPRLTFWLSNLIALRAILSKGVQKLQPAEVPCISSECDGSDSVEGSSLKRSWPHNTEEKENTVNYSDNWEDPNFFLIALEKVEAWIFSRIVESVWWQTLTPHMQSAAAKSSGSKKIYGRKSSLGDQEQGNFSIDLWKRAFKDACERLCPLRGVGHECGCLPVIARLVMEQLINRLDVAMFNAILRESDDEMPTDPISDPISDSKVLPIPAGKSGFGAGVQLKNVIGNWSRWLSDLFLIDDSESAEDKNENGKNKCSQCHTSFKPFHLLNALSDLMMLPFDMLTDGSTRNEVCPRFSVALIKRVLYNFVPDEFCPGPIPEAVLEALDAEDLEDNEGSINSFPCMAASTLYSPPAAASVMSILQEVGGHLLLRSGSSVLKKAYTSDDELDELDSPFSAAAIDDLSVVSTAKKGRDVVRYKLLRQVWKNSE